MEAEQEALTAAEVIVWQHPFYWYSAPALLKLWFEKVLSMGWAYGKGGTALVGKKCLWVTTTGAPEESYSPDGIHGHPFDAFVPVMLVTAKSDLDSRVEGLRIGADDYVCKPFDERELLARVSNMLRLKQMHDDVTTAGSRRGDPAC